MRKLVVVLLSIFLLALLASIAGGYYLVGYALTPAHRGFDLDSSFDYMAEEYPFLSEWMDSLQQNALLKDTTILNSDQRQLHGYYIAAAEPTSKTAVIVHGYTDNAIRMLHIGYMYSHDLGYNILLPDLQYHGNSEGEAVQMGWKDRLDVLQWMNTAHAIFGDSTQMVVHGISMGAATTMMLAGEPQQPFVKCFVEDCGYTSVWDQFSHVLHTDFGLPDFPLLYVANVIVEQKFEWNFNEASAINQVKKCHLPMLFIHGDADTFVPAEMVNLLYEAKPEPKDLWVVPDAGHARAYKEAQQTYTCTVKCFTEKYID